MTRLTTPAKKELAKLLGLPLRYRELKPLLLGYMPKTTYRLLASFESALRSDGLLKELELKTDVGHATTLYSSVDPAKWNSYHVAQALRPQGYFCNLTSMYHHGLTNQVPSRVYLAVEESRAKDRESGKRSKLSDDAIFDAFVQPHRVSRHNYRFRDCEIAITERVSRGGIGVEAVREKNRPCPRGARVTCLERAIIDAVVHPQYNGGLTAVVEMLRMGAPKANVKQLLGIYDECAFAYPYWQALGFLCERIGAAHVADAFARRSRPVNKFYLDHNAKTSWDFDSTWWIYYPKGLA